MLRSLRFWIGAAISVVLIVLFFRATNPGEIRDAFGEADYRYMAPAVAVLFVALWIRCYRWSLLMMRPIAAIPPAKMFSTVFVRDNRTCALDYMANNLLPARAGEVVRAYVVGDRENVSKAGTLGTIAVERLFDGVTLVLLLLASGAIVGLGDDRLQLIAVLSTVLFVVALAVFYWITATAERATSAIHAMASILPSGIAHRIEDIAGPFVSGLRSVHDIRTFGSVLALSIVAWIIEAGAYAIIGLGFDLGVSFAHYCLLLAAANLAIIIPTFFGGTGPFEWAARLVLSSAGVATGLAGAYAIIAHAVIFIPTTIIGLILLWVFGISLGRMSSMSVSEEDRGVAAS